jgi:exonuclease SbcD
VRLLHTSDWHVGRTIRGRSRADEHEAVLAEIAAIARAEAVDLVLVVGDLFDTAAPTAESERIAYAALLELAATGAAVVVVSGNHDNERRLQAVAPLLGLGHIVTRASFAAAADGGVVTGVTAAGEPWRVATIPFLSQRWIVRAADLLDRDADQHAGQYAARMARIVGALTESFTTDAVNVVAAHLLVAGGVLGGGERPAHTIFDYAVAAGAFPAAAHYVALGHLHRAQVIAGPCPIRYCGSPLQLDFGESTDTKSVTIVDAAPGLPAAAREVPLAAGRGLRTLRGNLEELSLAEDDGGSWLRIVVREPPRLGLADEVRLRFPNAVDVLVEDPDLSGPSPAGVGVEAESRATSGRSPHELFRTYLEAHGADEPPLVALFDQLLEEMTEADRADAVVAVGAGGASSPS